MDDQQVIQAIREDINQSLTLPGVEDVDVDAMFTDAFMADNTEFGNFEAFAEQYAASHDQEDVLGPQLDDFIQSHSGFGSWNNMRQQAEMGFLEDRLA